MNNKFFITTALQETFPLNKDEEVIFKGSGAELLKTGDIWQIFNFKVIECLWDDRKKLYNDYQNLQTIDENVLIELSSKLNQTHSTNNTFIYWCILIGSCIECLLECFFTVLACFNQSLKTKNFIS